MWVTANDSIGGEPIGVNDHWEAPKLAMITTPWGRLGVHHMVEEARCGSGVMWLLENEGMQIGEDRNGGSVFTAFGKRLHPRVFRRQA